MAIDKQAIIDTVLAGYALPISDPIPPGLLQNALGSSTPTTVATSSIDAAKKLLISKGWTISSSTTIFEKKTKTNTQQLSFSISTPDAPELVQIAKIIQKRWQDMGAQVDVKIFEASELNQNVIRPRHYDALLFGEIIGRDLDLYAFWHSSQRTDPGLNITGYVNLKVDKILETVRSSNSTDDRLAQYQKFESEIRNDLPASFIYSPQFTYVVPDFVQGISLKSVTIPAERFADIYHWYIETDSVWKIFIPSKNN